MIKATPTKIQWHSGLSIYASSQFLASVGEDYGWLGGMDDSGVLRCILPYTIIRKAMVRMVRFRIETIPLTADFEVEEEREFLDSVVEYLRSTGSDVIIPGTTNAIFRTYPHGAVAAPYGTHIIDLDKDEESLFNEMSSSHRRKIRLAIKAGIQVKGGLEYTGLAYELIRATFKRSSIPFMGYAEFGRMVESLGEYVKILVAEYLGVVQGCIVVPFSGHSAYYVYGGSVPEPATGAMQYLHWEAIRMFRGQGVQRYDFCGVRINPDKGSKQEGLMMFKERFGPRLVQGYMWKYPLRPLKAHIYSAAVRLLRGGDIVDAERHKLVSKG